MSRLRHSIGGFARQLQMSQVAVWVFVEGINDRAFYSNLCAVHPKLSKVPHRVILGREVPRRRANGKRALLSLYRYLRRTRALKSTLGGKVTTAIIFLDKDIDDILKRKARSSHVIYSQFYTVENHIVLNANVPRALACSASLDIASVNARIGCVRDWARNAAISWRDWLDFCVLVRCCKQLNSFGNYGVETSLIHDSAYSPVNRAKSAELYAAVQARAGWPAVEFSKRREAASRLVDKHINDGLIDNIFNGKWYVNFLVAEAEAAAGIREYCGRGLKDRLFGALLATLDFSAEWTTHFNSAIDLVVD